MINVGYKPIMNYYLKGTGNDTIDSILARWNKFIDFYWKESIHIGWATSEFIRDDIYEVRDLLLELCNDADEKVTIGMINYVDKIKEEGEEEKLYYIQHYIEIMQLLKYKSIQQTYRDECRKLHIPCINFNII